MDNVIKPLSRLLLLTVLVCGLSFQVSYVSGASKPSVPEFTVNLVAYPYDIPSNTTTSIDQDTGEEIVTTTPGYHVENRSIEIVIKNQPFALYISQEIVPPDAAVEEGIDFYYVVRVKDHFEEDWTVPSPKIVPSSSEYTVSSLPVADYPDDSQVDFQVEAVFEYYYDVLAGRPCLPLYELVTVTSGWSETQTITISEENVQNRLNEEIPEFPSWAILPLVLTVTVVVAVYKKKLTKHQAY